MHRTPIIIVMLVERLGDGVDIVGDAAEHLSVWNTVEVGQRHPVNLFADILSHRIAQLGCNTGHHPTLYIGQERTEHIQSCQEGQNLSNRRKVDASGSGEHRNQSLKQTGGCLTQNLGSENREYSAGCGTTQHQKNTGKKLFQISHQFAHRAFEVLGFFSRH